MNTVKVLSPQSMAYLSEKSIVSKIYNQNLHIEDRNYDKQHFSNNNVFICD